MLGKPAIPGSYRARKKLKASTDPIVKDVSFRACVGWSFRVLECCKAQCLGAHAMLSASTNPTVLFNIV